MSQLQVLKKLLWSLLKKKKSSGRPLFDLSKRKKKYKMKGVILAVNLTPVPLAASQQGG